LSSYTQSISTADRFAKHVALNLDINVSM